MRFMKFFSLIKYSVVWCVFCNCFSTDIYKDVIFVDAQKLKAKERDLQYQEITYNNLRTRIANFFLL